MTADGARADVCARAASAFSAASTSNPDARSMSEYISRLSILSSTSKTRGRTGEPFGVVGGTEDRCGSRAAMGSPLLRRTQRDPASTDSVTLPIGAAPRSLRLKDIDLLV